LAYNAYSEEGIVKRTIRAIRVGDVFSGKLITVGQSNRVKEKELQVTDIVHDMDYLKSFGIDKYDVYVQDKLGWGDKFIWQSFQRQPVSVTYECGIQG
jgi:hypothetical protein